jgi:hypothetical protein
MPARKRDKTPQQTPKSDAEVLKEIHEIIRDWRLARGAFCSNEVPEAIVRHSYLPKGYGIEWANARRVEFLPSDNEALYRIEAALGLEPKNRDECGRSFRRWVKPLIRKLTPADG